MRLASRCAVFVFLVLICPLRGRSQGEACEPLPTTSFEIRRTRRQSSPPDPERPFESVDVVGFGTSAVLDVDGDGTTDVSSPEPQAGDCVSSMHVAIYLSRGACGVRVGLVEGRPTRGRHRSHGLFDLLTRSEETVQDDPRVPAVRRTHERTYRFDGATYREVAHRTSDSVCHHCSLESCVSVPVMP